MFPLLAAGFFGMLLLTLTLSVLCGWCALTKRASPLPRWMSGSIMVVYACYLAFVWLGTGPSSSDDTASADTSYRAPWPAHLTSCVAQGHRSMVSHRGAHLHAWDFVRPLGSPITAARAGQVQAVTDHRDGVGWFEGNHILLAHPDGTTALYAHLARGSARVEVGQRVEQGEHIADVGMVGKTLFPHLHFVVQRPEGGSLPVRFDDIGMPLAGRCYQAGRRTR